MDEENREMFEQINALVGAVAKALDIGPEEAVRAIEGEQIALTLEVDETGQHYVSAKYFGKTVRVYQGAIQYAPEEPGAEDDGCGHSGCGCGG